MTRKIHIFDTTLRDGEQSPGASMQHRGEARHRAPAHPHAEVDVIEAGFPISSPGDFKSVEEIGRIGGRRGGTVCGLTRAVDKDIEVAAEALKTAKRPRIHTGLGVSAEPSARQAASHGRPGNRARRPCREACAATSWTTSSSMPKMPAARIRISSCGSSRPR